MFTALGCPQSVRMMDPDSVKSFADAGSATFTFLRELVRHLPKGKDKDDAESALAKAEHEFQMAEAAAAKELDMELCLRCWPPQIMRIADDEILRCRHCGKPFPGCETKAPPNPQVTETERKILEILFKGLRMVDAIAQDLGLEREEVSFYLVKLRSIGAIGIGGAEMEGLASQRCWIEQPGRQIVMHGREQSRS
jgi:ferredoxin